MQVYTYRYIFLKTNFQIKNKHLKFLQTLMFYNSEQELPFLARKVLLCSLETFKLNNQPDLNETYMID